MIKEGIVIVISIFLLVMGILTINGTITGFDIVIQANLDFVNESLPNKSTIWNEDQLYTKDVNATGGPTGDYTFSYTNESTTFSSFSINPSSGLINFTPIAADIGNYTLTLTVRDGGEGDIYIFNFTVLEVNDAPVLATIGAQVAVENELYSLQVTATDEEGANLTFADNTPLFNITKVSGSLNTASISATFNSSQTGNYSINISVSDGNSMDSEIINLFIDNVPNITSYTPSTYNISVAENSSIFFNHTSSDEDTGDDLTYTWYRSGTPKSTSSSWNYQANFTDAGTYNITLIVRDEYGGEDSQSWSLTVNNTERAPSFGLKKITATANFSGGLINQTNITLGNITLAGNGSNYYSWGHYTKNIIFTSTQETDFPNFTSISWIRTLPTGTNITIRVRTSNDNASWTNWSIAYTNNTQTLINRTFILKRYMECLFNFTTNNISLTPTLESFTINYSIANKSINKNTLVYSWIDVTDYFSDPDGSLTYSIVNYTNFSDFKLNFTFGSDGEVDIDPWTDWYGKKNVTIRANDTLYNVTSNTVVIEVKNVVRRSTSSSGGGGGGGATVPLQASLDIIIPSIVSLDIFDEKIVPVIVKNSGNMSLQNITLSLNASVKNIKLTFEDTFFKLLKKGEETTTQLTIKSNNATPKRYTVTIYGNVTKPKLLETALLYIDVIEEGLPKEIKEIIVMAKDLFEANPECLELNELLNRAESEARKGDLEKAELLAQTAIQGCKDLVSYTQGRRAQERLEASIPIVLISLIVLLSLVMFFLIDYMIRRKKK